jgi:hypothetical protein
MEAFAGLRLRTVTHGSAPSSNSRTVVVDETSALPDLLLKHSDETLATYV